MTTARVTVVVPCHDDDPEHLDAALSSVRSQTVAPELVETVVVNDGSSRPDLLQFLRGLQAPRIKVLTQPNAGPASARNAGIAAGSGDYVLPLDADDLISESFIEEAVQLLDHDPLARFCYSSISCFGASDELKLPPAELRLRDFFGGNRIVCTGVFRRADWQRLGGYDESMRHGFEDYEWWVRLLGVDDVARRLPEATFHYRIREGSRTAGQPGDPRRLTRAAIVTNNQHRLADLLEAGWEHADEQARLLAAAQAEVGTWRRRTALPRKVWKGVRPARIRPGQAQRGDPGE
jgi:glycosyltransferase involved in cell wall biosynthesis